MTMTEQQGKEEKWNNSYFRAIGTVAAHSLASLQLDAAPGCVTELSPCLS